MELVENKKINNIENYIELEELLLVEKTIKKYDGEYKKTKLWQKISKKISYTKFKIIIDYLFENNKISIDSEGKIGWIYYPELTKKYLKKTSLKI